MHIPLQSDTYSHTPSFKNIIPHAQYQWFQGCGTHPQFNFFSYFRLTYSSCYLLGHYIAQSTMQNNQSREIVNCYHCHSSHTINILPTIHTTFKKLHRTNNYTTYKREAILSHTVEKY